MLVFVVALVLMAMLVFVVALVPVECSTVALPDRVALGPQGVVGVVVPVLQQVLHVRAMSSSVVVVLGGPGAQVVSEQRLTAQVALEPVVELVLVPVRTLAIVLVESLAAVPSVHVHSLLVHAALLLGCTINDGGHG